jgi:predicted nucleic-acid-binding protein
VIGLDTNVLVRYLTQDDPLQSARANRLLEQQLSDGNPGFVSTVVMAETAWVLRRAYRFTTTETAAAIERMLAADALIVEREQEVYAAMIALREGLGSFADALVGAIGSREGCSHTATFDRKALRLPGFALA